MILRSIEVENWGCFTGNVHIGPLGGGLNLISGPNETGKSTVAEAIARGLFDRRSVTGAEASHLQPWDRAVGPRVALEITHEGEEYRIEKRFLVEPVARLEQKEGGRYELLAQGDEAEEKVRAFVGARLPGKGMTKPEHWGIAQLLFVRQGEIRPESIATDAEARLRRVLGALAEDPDGDRVERRITEEYRKLFTESGALKRGKDAAPTVTLSQRRAELLKRVQDLQHELSAIEELQRRLEDLRRKRGSFGEARKTVDQRLERLRDDERVYRDAVAAVKQKEAEEAAARTEHAQLQKRIEALLNLGHLRAEASQRRHGAESSLPDLQKEAAEAATALEGMSQAVQNVRADRTTLDHQAEEVDDARAFERASARVKDLAGRVVRIEDGMQRLEAARRALSALVAPDRRELQAIRKAIEARDEARLRLESSQIVLEVRAESPIQVDGRKLDEGETIVERGSPEVSLRIAGVARVRASGPAGDVADLEKERERHRAAVTEKTRPFATDNLDHLERLENERSEHEEKVREVEKEVEMLSGDDDPAELRAALTRARAESETVLSRRVAWRENPPDAEALEAERKTSERTFKRRIDEAESMLDAARAEERRAAESLTLARQTHDEADRELASIARRENEEHSDGLDAAGRAEARDRKALEWSAARAGLAEEQKKLDAFAEEPSKARERAEYELQTIDRAEREALAQEKKAEGELNAKNQSGVYTLLAREEEQLRAVEADLERQTLRANAIKLLFETLRAEKEAMIGELLAPVRTRVERNLRRIAGPRHGEVRFGASGLPETVRPTGSLKAVSLDTLSGGTEEQLFFVTRLALAECIASGGRETVILDDPLVNSDLDRISRALPILEEAAQSLQVLIFTCHPEAYRGLGDAALFDLAETRKISET